MLTAHNPTCIHCGQTIPSGDPRRTRFCSRACHDRHPHNQPAKYRLGQVWPPNPKGTGRAFTVWKDNEEKRGFFYDAERDWIHWPKDTQGRDVICLSRPVRAKVSMSLRNALKAHLAKEAQSLEPVKIEQPKATPVEPPKLKLDPDRLQRLRTELLDPEARRRQLTLWKEIGVTDMDEKMALWMRHECELTQKWCPPFDHEVLVQEAMQIWQQVVTESNSST